MTARPDTCRVEKIGGDFFSPQTPVLAKDGKRVFVADYPMGIGIVRRSGNQPGKLEYLPHPENIAVTGLDGLLLDGDSLIGIQNGTQPARIMRFRLNATQTEIISAEIIEQATERLGDPTHAAAANGMIYVSANTGWSKVDDHGNLKQDEHFTAPVLLRFPAEAPVPRKRGARANRGALTATNLPRQSVVAPRFSPCWMSKIETSRN